MKYAEVIIDSSNKNLDRIFNYSIPEEILSEIQIGMRVLVPFGKSNLLKEGYVIGFSNSISINKDLIKDIHSLKDKYSIFTEYTINIAKFMQNKYYCTLSECLQCVMPKIVKDRTKKYIQINYQNSDIKNKLQLIKSKNNLQSKVIDFLEKQDKPISLDEIKFILKISQSPISTLIKTNILTINEKEFTESIEIYDTEIIKSQDKSLTLTNEQVLAINFIKDKFILENNKKPIVLHGVTGSGKTEVYLKIVEETLKKNKQAIILVPEIVLTSQTVERFIERFGNLVTVTHSKLSATQRLDQWKRAKNSEISIMIGTRSAIFTPFNNLGVIIIDEEHESTYKSESNPKYDTREVAEEISRLTNCLVIYGSATPSIETYYKAFNKHYDLITMKKRVNNDYPEINIIDMRKEIQKGNRTIFSKQLFNAINENLKNNMQTILFLNRRGHSTAVSCRKCGYVMECSNCNVNYTYHLYYNKLICHYCNQTVTNPTKCPSCNSNYIKYFGIGTQKIEEETKKFFPTARVLRMDLDTTSTKDSHKKILEKFKNQQADILIGTQIIAKGLDFPKVSLVGVMVADISIYSGDHRSGEVSFQLLSQVSGRAGRSDYKGKVFIQTYIPEHYSIVYAKNNDYLGFYEQEIKDREINFYPPFSNIFLILLTSKDEQDVRIKVEILANILNKYNKKTKFQIMDFARATIYKINNNFRYKIMIKAEDEERLKRFVLFCVEEFKKQNDTKNINIILSLNPNFIQ